MIRASALRRSVARATRAYSSATSEKAVLVKGGTIVNADREWKGDILSIGEKIVEVSDGEAIEPVRPPPSRRH